MMARVRIHADLFAELVSAMRAALPNEGCSLAGGHGETIERLFPLTNVAASPRRYEADPAQQLEAYEAMTAEGLRCVAVCHSHPASPAFPSATDVALAGDPSVAYVIVSFAEAAPVARAFALQGGAVTPLELLIERSPREPAHR